MWMWIRHRFCKRVVRVFVGVVFGLFSTQLGAEGSYSALEIPYHVRSLSMSSVGIADARGMDITGINPSLLQSAQGGLILSIIRYPAEIQSEIVEWRMSWGARTGAISIRHLGYGIFEERNEDGLRTGQFSAGETWASLSLAQSLFHSFDIGVTGGALLSRIDNVTASLAVFTMGGVLTIHRFDMRVGFSIRHVGVTLDSYTGHSEPIPTNVNLGMTKRLEHLPLELSIDGTWWEREGREVIRLGGEFTLPYGLSLRLGTSSNRVDLKTDQLWQDITTGMGLGVGYQIQNMSVDLGIQYRGVAGTAIGLGFSTVL